MAAFGEELRRAREERGVAVETICDATKVPARHIRALEAGALDQLPGGVFRRGFVRSYLHVLGLEEAAWMQRFEQSCRESGMRDPAEMEWVPFAENVRNSRMAPRRRIGFRATVIVIVLLIAVAAWCGWRLKTHRPLIPRRHRAGLRSMAEPVVISSSPHDGY
ncbi:MAG TPA: helix-turn-helix domain-containing protein [Acidobacteriaceae bacterium]|nr:helix-turn-helix domain-containing protein [Acidobacteriaceae bacterium]